jgi:hypothetical protein
VKDINGVAVAMLSRQIEPVGRRRSFMAGDKSMHSSISRMNVSGIWLQEVLVLMVLQCPPDKSPLKKRIHVKMLDDAGRVGYAVLPTDLWGERACVNTCVCEYMCV